MRKGLPMPQAKRYAQGLIASKLLLVLVKTLAERMNSDGLEKPALADVILICAVFVGQAERRPMSAAKIAEYVGIPRPTAIRHLARLEAAGMLRQDAKKHWSIPFDDKRRLGHLDATSATLASHLRRAAEELSKLDASNVANR
jgi:DNA-binding transcriptional ArsR family regulator